MMFPAVPGTRLTIHKILMLSLALAIFLIAENGNVASALSDNDGNVTGPNRRSVEPPESLNNTIVQTCDKFCFVVNGKRERRTFQQNWRNHYRKVRVFEEIFADPSPAGELKPLTYAKNLYKACVNEGSKNDDWSDLREILRLFGGWPVIEGDSWSAENKSWRELQIKLSKTSFDGFMLGEFDKTDKTIKTYSIGSMVNDHCETIINIAVNMGANRDNARKEILEALEFDKKIPNPPFSSSPLSYFFLHKLEQNLSTSDITYYLPECADTLQDQLVVKFKDNFSSILDNTSLRVIYNHALMRLVVKLKSFSDNPTNRERQCANFVGGKLFDIQDILYVRKYFDKNTKSNVQKLIQPLIGELKEQFKLHKNLTKVQSDRFDDLNSRTTYVIAYPDEYFDDEKINAYYKNLTEIDGENFLRGLKNCIQYILNYTPNPNTFDIRKALGGFPYPMFFPASRYYEDKNKWGLFIPMVYLYHPYNKTQPKSAVYPNILIDLGRKIALNARKTLGLNISSDLLPEIEDKMIVDAAYSLYRKSVDASDPNFPFPGLENYTNNQKFWIHLAHSYCGLLEFNFTASETFRHDFNCPTNN